MYIDIGYRHFTKVQYIVLLRLFKRTNPKNIFFLFLIFDLHVLDLHVNYLFTTTTTF
jgi:hypothetical protein